MTRSRKVNDARRVPSVADAAPGSVRKRRPAAVAFGVVVVVVLGVGIALAAADLIGQRGTPSAPGAIPVRISMAGFDPPVLTVKTGQTVAIDFWTTDAAPHLQGGVHTFISEELGIREELPAESRRTFTFTAPTTPGDYDVYCDTCCGGKASPTMHAVIRVQS